MNSSSGSSSSTTVSSSAASLLHLFILSHGLQGNKGHMDYLAKKISEKQNCIVLNVGANDNSGAFKNWGLTSDGIVNGGKRMQKEVEEFIANLYKQKNQQVTHVSFIGSSMGGLYCRYVMGELYDTQKKRLVVTVDKNGSSIDIELVNFVSLASPLLSVRGLIHPMLYYGVKLVFFKGTGNQMLLEDKDASDGKTPIIYHMNDGKSKYFEALKQCSTRITLCSCKADEDKVPYSSSAILAYKDIELTSKLSNKLTQYKASAMIHSIHEDDAGAFASNDKSVNQKSFFDGEGEPMKKMIWHMIDSLRSMKWIRVNVHLYHAQAAVINSSRDDIAQVLQQLLQFK